MINNPNPKSSDENVGLPWVVKLAIWTMFLDMAISSNPPFRAEIGPSYPFVILAVSITLNRIIPLQDRSRTLLVRSFFFAATAAIGGYLFCDVLLRLNLNRWLDGFAIVFTGDVILQTCIRLFQGQKSS